MRITFRRFPGHAAAYSVIERDDGVVYRMKEFTSQGARLPHDLRHFVVERELGIADGIWGGIADGMVYSSMDHVQGRRPPHSAERSVELKRLQRQRSCAPELLANLVEAVAMLDSPTDDDIQRLTSAQLSVFRSPNRARTRPRPSPSRRPRCWPGRRALCRWKRRAGHGCEWGRNWPTPGPSPPPRPPALCAPCPGPATPATAATRVAPANDGPGLRRLQPPCKRIAELALTVMSRYARTPYSDISGAHHDWVYLAANTAVIQPISSRPCLSSLRRDV